MFDDMNDYLQNIMQEEAKKHTGGKIVYSEGRDCSFCGKPCIDADKSCLAKGFEIFKCLSCEPMVF